MSARLIRDVTRRKAVEAAELQRRAYLYVARNTTLPTKTRYQAQLALSSPAVFSPATRPTAVKERCTLTNRGRGVLAKVGLARFQFKLKATAGELNGWQKASF